MVKIASRTLADGGCLWARRAPQSNGSGQVGRANCPQIPMKNHESKGAVVSVVEGKHHKARRKPTFADYVFGRRLASDEEEEQKIGPLTGVPVLGLDALSSAAYGPEAADDN